MFQKLRGILEGKNNFQRSLGNFSGFEGLEAMLLVSHYYYLQWVPGKYQWLAHLRDRNLMNFNSHESRIFSFNFTSY